MVTYTLTGLPETLDMKLICRSHYRSNALQLQKDKNDRAQAQYDNSDCIWQITDAQSLNYRNILQFYTIVALTIYALAVKKAR